ncbi:nucleotidyl transferase AbiEii/AbiGii toxin family protein [Shinella sp.]|uniref:nucleotidyl transferase AbiEii/AbiGii toxin family protein n=1 Tax=Shinella sp. TaxID=1870904 RepID=UPI00289F7D92|nr:nucleotidyl transferase AbiEii/AbiGii toxin family protein [Shinella sp.]
MVEAHNQRPSEWRRLFSIACDLLDQVRDQTGGYPFQWSLGGGTAMMIRIGHRESHDIDIFLDDSQILGFLDPAKADLRFREVPASYGGDGARFQKFAFEDIGEIDFIAAGPLTSTPFEVCEIEGRDVNLETIPEIITKKIYYRGSEAKPRDIFDLAAAAAQERTDVISALQAFPEQAGKTQDRFAKLNPEFVSATISQLMILPAYTYLAADSLSIAQAVLSEVLSSSEGG